MVFSFNGDGFMCHDRTGTAAQMETTLALDAFPALGAIPGLADRNILIDQTMVNDFRPIGGAMVRLSTKAKTIERAAGTELQLALERDADKKRRIDTAYEIYLGHYQAISGPEERQNDLAQLQPGAQP